MIVKDLIAKLSEYPPDMEVCSITSNINLSVVDLVSDVQVEEDLKGFLIIAGEGCYANRMGYPREPS